MISKNLIWDIKMNRVFKLLLINKNLIIYAPYLKNNLNICILENGSKNHLQQEEYLPH